MVPPGTVTAKAKAPETPVVDPHAAAGLRVLLLTDETDQPDGIAVATRRWVETAISLDRTGCRVFLATLRGFGPLNEQVRAAGIDTFSLRCTSVVRVPGAIWRTTRYIRREKIDVIHGNEVIPALVGSLAGLLARRGHRIYVRHHTTSSRKHSLASWLVARLASTTLGVSQAVGDHARRLDRTSAGRVRVVPNGVAPPRVVPAQDVAAVRERLGIGGGDKLVVTVARLRAEKGIDCLLRASALLPELGVGRVHVVVVGSGPEEPNLRRLASELGTERIHFAGHQDDVVPWLAAADLFVAPSHREAAPLAVLEAMACGRAVVASRVGGLPEAVSDPETGLLVASGDPEALARAIARLLSDDGLRDRMGAAARRSFEESFTIDRMAEGWAAMYREVLPEP